MEKKQNTELVVTAIILIAILEAIALMEGIDGTVFTMTIAAITGLAGYTLPSPFNKK